MPGKIVHVELPLGDVPRAVGFWRGLLAACGHRGSSFSRWEPDEPAAPAA